MTSLSNCLWGIPLCCDLFKKRIDQNFFVVAANNWTVLAVRWSVKYFLKKEKKSIIVKRYAFQANAINFEWSKFVSINVTLEFDALKGTRKFVQNTTFGLVKKMKDQFLKMFCKIPNEHACDYLRYVTLLICFLRSVVRFWGVIEK